jgi:isopentenyl diphosphate isomerase/L-lactate dehydrogenase-like FMN-dependent dehydrogenase
VTEVEIGGTKRGRIAYSFDDIALVPTRRTRNPEDVSTNWKIDAYDFSFPIMAAPMDSVVSPDVAINYGKLVMKIHKVNSKKLLMLNQTQQLNFCNRFTQLL